MRNLINTVCLGVWVYGCMCVCRGGGGHVNSPNITARSSICTVVREIIFGTNSNAFCTSSHEQRNRSGRPGNRPTNVFCMVAEKLADAISEVLN